MVFYNYNTWEIGKGDLEHLTLIIDLLVVGPRVHYYWGGSRGSAEASQGQVYRLIKTLFKGYPIVGEGL